MNTVNASKPKSDSQSARVQTARSSVAASAKLAPEVPVNCLLHACPCMRIQKSAQ